MKTDILIQEKLNKIVLIISKCDYYTSKLEQISTLLTEKEANLFIKYQFLDMVRYSFWDLAVLEIIKLFNPKEKYSLKNILNIVINKHTSVKWKIKIPKSDLEDFMIKIESNTELIERIKNIRDNYIAHLDHNKSFDTLVTSDLRILLKLSQSIYNTIYWGVYNSDMIWDFKEDTQDLILLKNLVTFESLRETIVQADFKNMKHILTSDLIEILLKKGRN